MNKYVFDVSAHCYYGSVEINAVSLEIAEQILNQNIIDGVYEVQSEDFDVELINTYTPMVQVVSNYTPMQDLLSGTTSSTDSSYTPMSSVQQSLRMEDSDVTPRISELADVESKLEQLLFRLQELKSGLTRN